MTNMLIGIVMTILVLLVLGFIVGYSVLTERLAARRPKSGQAEAPTVVSRPIAEEAPQVRPSIAALIMSTLLGAAGPIEAPATPVAATPHEAGQPIAKPGNVVNDALTGNVLPEEVRETIRFWAMIESTERIIAGGKIGQTEAIELVFNCKRSGRPDSLYARARAALNARTEATYRANQARLVELQAAHGVE